MPSVLVQFAHPSFYRSRIQKALVKTCKKLDGITINDLYEQYPDLHIDVKREQDLLLKHDILVLQHPFYWYSGPAIIKQWLDLVLEYNWAYGPKGFALQGKKMLSAISCGGGENAYTPEGHNSFPISQFLLPYRQTASLCRMEYMPPFVVYGTHRKKSNDIDDESLMYADILSGLASGRIQPENYRGLEVINSLGHGIEG
ncbi:NAD(P)H-dependent oxidoreductase [Terrimonas sp. NA20]|uniref:NAD(P)H-dependent oxidoreductase n=1 Tax=Terrimonas ginsenosidimutans TaxID=2908004 RepID=A0ABS9KYN1_9BACT|nr:NAD(P)H-dependent oxidoreductase [Terrimonas ginsenosidimutans]MCG2617449.1 NAD(P)H-dependent oxidoreductase [Terrimonas ginsenosidimutans]